MPHSSIDIHNNFLDETDKIANFGPVPETDYVLPAFI